MSGKGLSKAQLVELFDMLSERLHRRGVVARIYVIGGACMALGYDGGRFTEDVDVRIDAGEEALFESAQEIAQERGLAKGWINDLSMRAMDVGRDERAETLYESGNLVATGASAEFLLGMKLSAGRDKDVGDIELLIDRLGIKEGDEALDVYRAVIPGCEGRRRARALVGALAAGREGLAAPTGGTERERKWVGILVEEGFPRYAVEEKSEGWRLTVKRGPEDSPDVLGEGLTLHSAALIECGHRGWPSEAVEVIKGVTAVEVGRGTEMVRKVEVSRRR